MVYIVEPTRTHWRRNFPSFRARFRTSSERNQRDECEDERIEAHESPILYSGPLIASILYQQGLRMRQEIRAQNRYDEPAGIMLYKLHMALATECLRVWSNWTTTEDLQKKCRLNKHLRICNYWWYVRRQTFYERLVYAPVTITGPNDKERAFVLTALPNDLRGTPTIPKALKSRVWSKNESTLVASSSLTSVCRIHKKYWNSHAIGWSRLQAY